jgi:hypothetical protein
LFYPWNLPFTAAGALSAAGDFFPLGFFLGSLKKLVFFYVLVYTRLGYLTLKPSQGGFYGFVLSYDYLGHYTSKLKELKVTIILYLNAF